MTFAKVRIWVGDVSYSTFVCDFEVSNKGKSLYLELLSNSCLLCLKNHQSDVSFYRIIGVI